MERVIDSKGGEEEKRGRRAKRIETLVFESCNNLSQINHQHQDLNNTHPKHTDKKKRGELGDRESNPDIRRDRTEY